MSVSTSIVGARSITIERIDRVEDQSVEIFVLSIEDLRGQTFEVRIFRAEPTAGDPIRIASDSAAITFSTDRVIGRRVYEVQRTEVGR